MHLVHKCGLRFYQTVTGTLLPHPWTVPWVQNGKAMCTWNRHDIVWYSSGDGAALTLVSWVALEPATTGRFSRRCRSRLTWAMRFPRFKIFWFTWGWMKRAPWLPAPSKPLKKMGLPENTVPFFKPENALSLSELKQQRFFCNILVRNIKNFLIPFWKSRLF